jgi:malonate-semialdehyde dehydrogenase (acetylating)/methylmalonate-semialdehyde dehydrogenase
MAASAMLAVGNVDPIIDQIVEEARKVIPGKNLGAVISRAAKERIESYITAAEHDGAKVLVDGRGAVVEGKENGTYVGPTVIDHVQPGMSVATEEIFGPVISIMRTASLEEALKIENENPYGNAAAVFTQSGGCGPLRYGTCQRRDDRCQHRVPVPREPFSFGGWNESRFGSNDITGKSSIEFWTKLKKTTTKWNPEAGVNWMS